MNSTNTTMDATTIAATSATTSAATSVAPKRRVVVTGVGALSPLGNDWTTVRGHLLSGRNVIRVMDEWNGYDGLSTRLGCTVAPFV